MTQFFGVVFFLTLLSSVIAKHDLPNDVLLPEKVCPHGFHLSGKACSRMNSVDPRVDCPRHSKLIDGSCVSTELFEGVFACPAGFMKTGDKCIKLDSVLTHVSCRKGFTFDGQKCTRISYFDVVHKCDHGFDLSHDGVCYRKSKVAANSVCPSGYYPDRRGCVAYEEAGSIPTCRRGFMLHGNECVLEEVRSPNEKCQPGFKFDRHSGDCVNVDLKPAVASCPQGQMDGHKCVEVLSDSPVPTCRSGFSYANGKCVKVVEDRVRFECKRGYRLEGDKCVSREYFKPELLCQKGFELKHGRCETVQVVKATLVCNNDFQLVGGKCVSRQVKAAEMTCPKGFVNSDKGCKKPIYEDSQYKCGNGSELSGKYCIEYETRPAVPVCKGGNMGTLGKCVEVEEAEQVVECPKRYSMKDGQCVKEVYSAGDVVCSKGGSVTRSGLCEKQIAVSPSVSCPRGYNMEGTGCSRIEEIEAIYKCQKGYKLIHGMCIPTQPQIRPNSFKRHGKSTPVKFNKLVSMIGSKGTDIIGDSKAAHLY